MDFAKNLSEIGLDSSTAVVIGSGILNALDLRTSNDIDLVVDAATYDRLEKSGRFSPTQNHGRIILTDAIFEIGTHWEVLGKKYTLANLTAHSTIIGGIRYITPKFLLDIKRSWLVGDSVRPKDITDVELLEKFLHL
jgi:hypothetical protein